MKSLIASIALFSVLLSSASGMYSVTAIQDGNDVLFTGSGTLDISGLSLSGSFNSNSGPGLYPQNQMVRLGTTATPASVNYYSGFTSTPSDLGSTTFTAATSGTGNRIEVNGTYLHVPSSYTSGGLLESVNRFDNTDIATLGLTPGIYTWTWSSDSYVLEIVPEPSTAAFVSGAAVLAFVALRRRKARPQQS